MIMLVGIVKKNAIMMIDFALQRPAWARCGGSRRSIYEAAIVRFRPIMMTTMAALMGTLPIALGSGMARISRRAAGTVCRLAACSFRSLLTHLHHCQCVYTYSGKLAEEIWQPSARLPRMGRSPAMCDRREMSTLRQKADFAVWRKFPEPPDCLTAKAGPFRYPNRA